MPASANTDKNKDYVTREELTRELNFITREDLERELSVIEQRRARDEQNNLERNETVKEAAALALANTKEAVKKYEETTNERFAKTNEFRQVLSDQTATFITRLELNAIVKGLEEKFGTRQGGAETRLTALTERMDRREGQGSGAGVTISYIAIGISILIGLFEVAKTFLGK
jgi:hypothetical protein